MRPIRIINRTHQIILKENKSPCPTKTRGTEIVQRKLRKCEERAMYGSEQQVHQTH